MSLEKRKIVDGCHFSSLEEVEEMILEKMYNLDGCHFSSLKEVEEVSLQKMNFLDGCHSSSLQEVGEASHEKMVMPVKCDYVFGIGFGSEQKEQSQLVCIQGLCLLRYLIFLVLVAYF